MIGLAVLFLGSTETTNMLRVGFLIALGFALFAGSNALAAESWGIEHPAAKARLLKLFENHPGFREAFTEWTAKHHKTYREMTEFLAKKDDHVIAEFIRIKERRDEELPALEHIYEKHREGLAEYRVFVKEHKEAALALVEHEHEIEKLEAIARRRD